MVRQWQQLFYNERYSSSFMGDSPDFVKLAEAFGAVGLRATKVGEVEGVLEEAFRVTSPVVIDFQVDPFENCYPMIPAGAGHNEMVFKDPEKNHKTVGQKNAVKEEDAEGVLTA